MRGDWASYFDVLADAHLYHAMPRGFAEANPGYVTRTPYWQRQAGRLCYTFLTDGMLPPPVSDPVFFRTDLAATADKWADPAAWLAINPGSPCEAYFPARPQDRFMWQQHAQRVSHDCSGALRTLWVGGPLHGLVAHGLACGALLCVSNGSLWNAMGWHGTGFPRERERLQEWWGIASRADWLEAIEGLLQTNVSQSAWEFVLQVRRAIAREYGGMVEPSHWREVIERVVRHREGEKDAGAEVGRLHKLVGRIARYEARFRADGLLGESKQVRSVAAWHLGRASKMARWGLGARYCDPAEAQNAVVRAGRAAQVSYSSWEDFSAGYILGRCLHFDEEEFGGWYQDMLEAHRILVTDPSSPWLNLPFK